MEPSEYSTLFEFEPSYWWYRHLHDVLLDTIRDLPIPSDSVVLDAGCGTGQLLVRVASQGMRATGFDISHHAAAFWAKRGLRQLCIASLNEIPFRSGTFSLVMSVDVLECDEVDERRAVAELGRVLAPGGHLLLVVPAYKWLVTAGHHAAVHAWRRYEDEAISKLISEGPFDLVRLTHLFWPVLPAIACVRLGLRVAERLRPPPPRSELWHLPHIVDELLYRIVGLERWILRRRDLGAGTSILAVARKRARA